MSEKNIIKEQMSLLTQFTENTKYKLSDIQKDQFEIYLTKLLHWNKRTNLISRNDENNIVTKHFLESISMLDVIDIPSNSSIIDIGTGAGFPGLPLKIIRPDLTMVLLDSKRFKVLFLKDVLKAFDFDDVIVVNERSEVAGLNADFNENFDYILARAVTNLKLLYKVTFNFLKDNSYLLALKGGNLKDEVLEFREKYQSEKIEIIPIVSMLLQKERDIVVVKVQKC